MMTLKSKTKSRSGTMERLPESRELKKIFYSEARRILGRGKEADELARSAMAYFVLRYKQN